MEVHLPGVPHVFTDYQGLVGFLRNSPGYVQAQHPFLTRYWAGALHAAGYSIPQVKPVAPVAQAPRPVRQPVRPAPVAPVARVKQAPERQPTRAPTLPRTPAQAAALARAQNAILPSAKPLSAAEKLHPPRPVKPGDAPFPLIDPLIQAAARGAPGPRQQEGIVGVHSIASAVRGEPVSPWGLGADIAGLLPIAPIKGAAAVIEGLRAARAAETGARAVEGARAARAAYSTAKPITTAAAKIGAKIGETPVDETGQAVMRATGAARKAQAEQKQIYRAERAKRAQASRAAYEQAGGGVTGHRAALGALRGEMQKVPFDRLTHIDDSAMKQLFDRIDQHPGLGEYDKINLRQALLRAREGHAPRLHEIKLVEKVFGPDNAAAFSRHGHLLRQIGRGAGEIANVPRSIMSSVDVSFPLRQGLVAFAHSPKTSARTLGPMFKYLTSERRYQQGMKAVAQHPSYDEARQAGVKFTDLSSDLGAREEQFMSNLAEKITGGKHGPVRASSRAYTGYSNELRIRLYHEIVAKARASGAETPKIRRDAARFVNWATGRGELGPLERAAPILSTIFFSPRLAASRFQTFNPQFYASLDPLVRKEAIKATAKLLGGGGAIAGAATLAGGKVGTDPTSADFGKLRFGNTRVDIWGGHQQWARLAAQLAEGKVTSSTSGHEIGLGGGQHGLSRMGVIGRFARGKESPSASLGHDLLAGADTLGRPFSWKREVGSRSVPLLAQDTAAIYQSTKSPLAAAAGYGIGAFGVGIQSYGSPATKAQREAHGALALVRKLGIGTSLPPDVAKSYTRAAQRDKAWADAASGKKPGTRDYYVARYKADIQLAQQWGYLTKAEAARENEWVAHAPIDDVRKAHADLSKPGGMYDQELSESRDTTVWLTAQDKYAADLDQAVKAGVLDAKQAQRERAWARNAGAAEIDQNRTALERELLAPKG